MGLKQSLQQPTSHGCFWGFWGREGWEAEVCTSRVCYCHASCRVGIVATTTHTEAVRKAQHGAVKKDRKPKGGKREMEDSGEGVYKGHRLSLPVSSPMNLEREVITGRQALGGCSPSACGRQTS